MARHFRIAASVLLMFLMAMPSFAWNSTGHWMIATIAYDRLTQKTRARVDELIRMHPDYLAAFAKDAPQDPGARARYAFVRAAVWPDDIRNDPRFYDETKPDATPAPALPGFPDTKKHQGWHYINKPYSQDGSPVHQPEAPNVLTELPRLIAEVSSPNNLHLAAYDLPWVLHLAGDAHQPLHVSNRFVRSQPKGDAGGNFVFVVPGRTLHSVWDDAPGPRNMPYEQVLAAAKELAESDFAKSLRSEKLSRKPEKWIDESYSLVKSDVYRFGLGTGSREEPLPLPVGYEENARRVSQRRIIEAGYRLAAVLNDALN